MNILFKLGEYLVTSIGRIGDFLLYEPFSPFLSDIDFSMISHDGLREGLSLLGELPLGAIVLGHGLIVILNIKIIKFFVRLFF